MDEQPPELFDPALAKIEPRDPKPVSDYSGALTFNEWRTIWWHLSLGVFASVGVLVALTVLGALLELGMALFDFSPSEAIESFMILLMTTVAGIAYCGFATAVGAAVDRFIHLRLPASLKGAMLGGVAFGLPICGLPPRFHSPTLPLTEALQMLILAGVATIVGQYSGAIGGKNCRASHHLVFHDGTGWKNEPWVVREQVETLQFTVAQLLAGSTLLAIVMTLVRLSDSFSPMRAFVVLTWFAMQTATLAIGFKLWPSLMAVRSKLFH